ncbi:hypothetical protein A6R68_04816 [Neotoma lepida]|uniref:Thymidylate synthase n=1 Tax=Neotoma lepida TaxID=56216 RepID=A0A1A6GL99_NEOLE|nr:hypothetical protein A6R68_04816 [Neotoma lepida]
MPVAGSEMQSASQQQGAEAAQHGELQYLGQVEHILRCGFKKEDRTGTGTLSVFGMQARYSLRGDRGWSPLTGGTAGGCPAGWARGGAGLAATRKLDDGLLYFCHILTALQTFSDEFPLLTTKRVFWKGVLEELLWFIKPGDFVHTLGDAHIYLNHIEPLKIQREPRPFPKLKILRKVETIDDFKVEDFQIEGYNPHPTIKMEMAV